MDNLELVALKNVLAEVTYTIELAISSGRTEVNSNPGQRGLRRVARCAGCAHDRNVRLGRPRLGVQRNGESEVCQCRGLGTACIFDLNVLALVKEWRLISQQLSKCIIGAAPCQYGLVTCRSDDLFLKPLESSLALTVHHGQVHVEYTEKAICKILRPGGHPIGHPGHFLGNAAITERITVQIVLWYPCEVAESLNHVRLGSQRLPVSIEEGHLSGSLEFVVVRYHLCVSWKLGGVHIL